MSLRFADLILIISVALIAAVNLINPTTAQLSVDIRASESQSANASLRLYTNRTVDEYTSVLIGDAANLIEKINGSRPTVMYIFGWLETPDDKSAATVIPAYLARQDHNVMVVDWQEIASKTYPFAALSASGVGSAIAGGLNKLVAAGLNSSTLHIVSHSLGSQVAGFVGRNVNFSLPRITGLDPAGPGFYTMIDDLSYTDALFVDIIHTDARHYGTASNKGTVNFHANGGSRYQSGCPLIRIPLSDNDLCDHRRSWQFYAESLLNETAFVGLKCESYLSFGLGMCSSNAKVVMGYATPSTARGDFYLQTNSKPPFGRGMDGLGIRGGEN